MYFIQVCNWFYQCMQVPVPIVIFNDQVALVTIFDVFMFLVYLGIFIVFIILHIQILVEERENLY